MRVSVRDWLADSVDALQRQRAGMTDVNRELANLFDLYARLEKPLSSQMGGNTFLAAVVMSRDDDTILDFVDFFLPGLDTAPSKLEDLFDILERGGSVWRVALRDGRPGLERRMDDTAMAAADKTMAESGYAGTLLEQAWQKVYGRNPDPKGAYTKAVLAVEEAAVLVVTRNDKKSTLGKIAQVMRDQGDWRYVLHEGGVESAQDAPLHQVQELWHRDPRHANGEGTYRDPTQQEAETAVFLAVGLVHMFHNGLIARRS